jgi:Fis family transcriptional regulator
MATDTSERPALGQNEATIIERCIEKELKRYFALLEGQPPADLYRLVMRQAEGAVIRAVLAECKGNQSRAASWLGISRGTLRGKLAEQSDSE